MSDYLYHLYDRKDDDGRFKRLHSMLITHVRNYLRENVSFYNLTRSVYKLENFGNEEGQETLKELIPLHLNMLTQHPRQRLDTLIFRVKYTVQHSAEYWALLEQIVEQHMHNRNAIEFVYKYSALNPSLHKRASTVLQYICILNTADNPLVYFCLFDRYTSDEVLKQDVLAAFGIDADSQEQELRNLYVCIQGMKKFKYHKEIIRSALFN